jgi:hypothetical protein
MWIVDNFLPRSYFNEIKQMIEHPSFRWNFSSILPEGTQDQTNKDWYFMKRICSHNEPIDDAIGYWQTIRPILYFLEDRLDFVTDHIISCNVNSLMNQNRERAHGWHNDCPEPHFVALFYINTCMTSPTLFEDGNHVDHFENRMLFFEGGDHLNRKHSTNLPLDVERRLAINFNLYGHFNS